MALRLLYYNLIIPIEKIPDFDAYLVEKNHRIGPDIRYDEYLYVESGMGYNEIESSLQFWNSRAGLVGMVEYHGRNHWVDLCCVAQGQGLYPDAVCDWIRYDPFRDSVFHVSDNQRKIVSSMFVPIHDVDGYVIEGRLLNPTKKSRGVVGLDDGLWFNFDSKGFFRFVLPLRWNRELRKGRVTQRMSIHDFVSNKQFVYEFEVLADKRTILEINGGDGTVQIHHDPFEPIDKEKVARIGTLMNKTSLDEAEIDKLLTAIAEGTVKTTDGDVPSIGVRGREVSILTRCLSENFDRFECEYFAWNTDPPLKQPDKTFLKSISFETILARKMEKHGYRFAKVSDPYQVDWNRTLFFRADETTTTDGTEVKVLVQILKITLTTYRESGQPCLSEEGVWDGNFTLGSSFHQDHREHIAERISRLINEEDINRVEEW
jgi:hypothetical protein